jgi:transportin-3
MVSRSKAWRLTQRRQSRKSVKSAGKEWLLTLTASCRFPFHIPHVSIPTIHTYAHVPILHTPIPPFQIIQSADQLSVSNDAIVGLLKGAAEVLSQLPHEKVTAGMRGLVQLQITPLLELTQSSHLGKVGTSGDPALWMDRLTALFRSCSIEMDSGQQSHPCQPVVEELWPVIAAVVTTYQSDDKIMERTCRCVRFILRCLGKYSYSILTPLVELAIQVYKSHHQSCFLYLGSIIVDEFGSDPNYQQGLLFMLVAFAEVSFPLLSGPTGLIDNPDTIDDIFRLCSRFIQHVPETFLASPVAPASIQCALAASVLDHRDAFSSVMKFFRDLLTLGKNGDLIEADKMQRQAVVSSFIAEHGATIMDRLVQGYVTLPTYMLTESTEVLWTFLEQSKEVCMTLLQSSIEKLPVRSTMKVMADQQTAIILSVSRCDDVEKLYPVIKDLARLYR